ncbi:clusterin-associated protein 1-like isoform X2 [Daphnia pulex]|uniref:clusterin-associated protein 1-like isoform X2 n=1 Tax=Daphnia pulex TaxID=6669 RepID=UPI001EDC9825|nr:clusterin-associated protein 1-like isoform X2 [Daphnia pulex]
MSYREITDFIDKMCLLGYPRLISRENFRSTNFGLVAEILNWFCQQLDVNSGINFLIKTEQERVVFVTSVVKFLNTKLQIKLNPKRLYQADNIAVRELLNVANFFYEALQLARKGGDNNEPSLYGFGGQAEDVREMRQLASEITTKGASIHDFLGQEMRMKNQRDQVLQRTYELGQIETALQSKMKKMEVEISQKQEAIDSISNTEASMDQKIDKKSLELQRLRKRLETMKNIRPPFMDEFEKLEAELRQCYEDYVSKFRCLSYLDSQWQELEKNEQQELEERQAAARKMAERLRQEETLQALEAAVGGTWEGGQDFDLSSEGSLESPDLKDLNKSGSRPRIGSRRAGLKNESDLLDTDTEDSDLDAEDPRLEEGSDSDVTIDEWQNESRPWQVGPGNSNRPIARNEPLIKPIPANVSEDDF